MGEIAASFGLTFPKFIAQIIIFLIVYYVLKTKAFGPIQAMLAERRARIEAGEEKLKKIEDDQKNAEAKAQAVLDEANDTANRLIEEARESGQTIVDKKTQEASTEAQKIISNARDVGERERKEALSDLKRDFGRLVVDTTSKVTGKVLDDEDHKKINQETATQLN